MKLGCAAAFRPTVLDLFSGAGGTGLGFVQAGFRIVGAVEKDRNAAETYRRNLNVDVFLENIAMLEPRTLREKLGLGAEELDVLVGCPPCQGFSRMRNGNGHADERNLLVLRYLEFVREFKPHFAFFENVPGLVRSAHGKEYYASLRQGLLELGYGVSEREVDAADYGVPQHRSRWIMVAARNHEVPPMPWPTHADPVSEVVRRGFRLPWKTVQDAIGMYPPAAVGGPEGGGVPNHTTAMTGEGVIAFIRQVPKNGGSRFQVDRDEWLECHLKHAGHRDVYGRLVWESPAKTLTGGCTSPSKGRYVHPEQDRGLTFREAAALQGFPDNFIFCGGRMAAQIGNAVPPPLARAVATVIMARLYEKFQAVRPGEAEASCAQRAS